MTGNNSYDLVVLAFIQIICTHQILFQFPPYRPPSPNGSLVRRKTPGTVAFLNGGKSSVTTSSAGFEFLFIPLNRESETPIPPRFEDGSFFNSEVKPASIPDMSDIVFLRLLLPLPPLLFAF